jgi:hypothetical protein
MHPQIRVVALLSAIALAACSSDVIAPEKATTALNSRTSAVVAQSGDYIVSMKGNAIASGFADAVKSLGGTVIYVHPATGLAFVTGLTSGAAAQLNATEGVASVAMDLQLQLNTPMSTIVADAVAPAAFPTPHPTNPAAAVASSWQWNMQTIGADKAWKAGKFGSSTVTVAIIDTGIDYDGFDLNGLVDLSRSTSFVPSDDAIRAAFFPGRNNISDFEGHGTNVAAQVSSIAAAFGGVTSKTTLIGVKVLSRTGSGSTGGVLAGILWAADHGANIANMSLGGSFDKAGAQGFGSVINKVFNYARQKDMLIVVAAGNADEAHNNLPVDIQHNGNEYIAYCDAPHVMCVAAIGPTTYDASKKPPFNPDVPAWYSFYGQSKISVAAPGGNYDAVNYPVLSRWPWGVDFASWVFSLCSKTRIAGALPSGAPNLPCKSGGNIVGEIGTSQASPHVAGLAALLMAQYGTGNPQGIKKMIEQSSAPIDPRYGKGRISVSNALGL